MENILLCTNAVLPSVLIMALGLIARKMDMLHEGEILRMNKVTFSFFLPFMVFNSIYKADIASAMNLRLIGFIVLFVLISFALSLLFTRGFIKDIRQHGVVIQGLFRSECIVIGIPIISCLFPGADLSPVAIAYAVVGVLFNTLGVICLSVFTGKEIPTGRIILNIMKNPLIVASVAGVFFLLSGLRMPDMLVSTLNDLAKVGGPLMLFLLGAFFRFNNCGKYKKELVCVCLGRLLVLPAIVFAAAYAAGFRALELAAMIGPFAAATSVSSFTMSQQMGADGDLAGNFVVFTSILCPISLFLWCMLFKSIGAM